MEFLISRWSSESYTFIAAWGELFLTLEDVIVLPSLPLCGESRAIKMPEDFDEITLAAEAERRLSILNKTD